MISLRAAATPRDMAAALPPLPAIVMTRAPGGARAPRYRRVEPSSTTMTSSIRLRVQRLDDARDRRLLVVGGNDRRNPL